uniref:Anti-sigma K factor RskA C-terminal domain-containing protein n=1 Tax=uncultured Nocardioidaceae bacterium TaxID=253824 RepID=A0A6J4L0F2_9ACTN|nr:MAG: hypothetical protein AVDCRST_MAG46-707 [uncultured Nocardioidaceae bacterium]
MPHLDDDLLALLALREQAPEAETEAHLDGCERCRHELAELRRVVTAGRSSFDTARELTAPAPHVWDQVTAAVGIDAASPPQQPVVRPRDVGASIPLRSGVARRGVPTWLGVAAGVAIGVGGAVAFQALDPDRATQPDEGALVASAELAEFGDTGTSGTAEVRETDDARVVHVKLDEPAQGRGFREVWLLDTANGDLISLGVLNGRESTFALPDDLDLRDFPVVDISRELLDGDPAHSSDSISRGELRL